MPTINRLKRQPSAYNSEKKAKRAKIYGTQQWREFRLLQLQNNPLCHVCESGFFGEKKIKLADQVHHLVSVMNEQHRYDESNVISICAECHGRIHKSKQEEKLRLFLSG